MMIAYLNQDHAVFKKGDGKRNFAVAELLKDALAHSESFRIEFDAQRLRRVVGPAVMDQLVTGHTQQKETRHRYDVYAARLDDRRVEILRQVMKIDVPQDLNERPLNYIKSLRLLDKSGETIFRGGDHNQSVLFNLPKESYARLLSVYRRAGIPETVVEQLNVDVNRLVP